jgi:hypothetical protein
MVFRVRAVTVFVDWELAVKLADEAAGLRI